LVGAILVGSTRTREPEALHPAASDVDIFCGWAELARRVSDNGYSVTRAEGAGLADPR
jgi:hypothetical protein